MGLREGAEGGLCERNGGTFSVSFFSSHSISPSFQVLTLSDVIPVKCKCHDLIRSACRALWLHACSHTIKNKKINSVRARKSYLQVCVFVHVYMSDWLSLTFLKLKKTTKKKQTSETDCYENKGKSSVRKMKNWILQSRSSPSVEGYSVVNMISRNFFKLMHVQSELAVQLSMMVLAFIAHYYNKACNNINIYIYTQTDRQLVS